MAMKIFIHKKSIFFTLISLILIMALTVFFRPQSEINYDRQFKSVEIRINNIDTYIKSIEDSYIPAIGRTVSYKTFTSLIYYMNTTNDFLDELEPVFEEVFLYGTISDTPIDEIIGEEVMANNTFTNWTTRLEEIADDTLNVDLDFTDMDVVINQTSPWYVDIEIIMSYTVSSETAVWKKENKVIETRLSLSRLYDPLYYVNTNGTYKKKIVETDTEFYEWNNEKFKDFVRNETYFHWQSSNASSYLMRFTNTFASSSCCGIESAVNPNQLQNPGHVQSYIDYLFWNETYDACSELYNGSEEFTEFPEINLDFESVIRYNISNLDLVC